MSSIDYWKGKSHLLKLSPEENNKRTSFYIFWVFLCEIIMLGIYQIVIVQRFGGNGGWIWFLQRWRKVWRSHKKPLVPFWRLPLQSDFEKSLTGNSTRGCKGSTGGSTGGGRELFFGGFESGKMMERVTKG